MADFLSYTGTVGIQVIILFLMIGVGFIISKKGLLTSDGAAQMTNLLLYIVTPCVIISSFESMEFNSQSAGELLIAAGCAVATHVIGFVLGLLIFRKSEKKDKVTLVCSSALSNCGFMGIPMAEALVGGHGVFLTSVYIAVFNLFVWIVGYMMFTGGKLNLKKAIINPGVIGILVGLVLFFTNINLPYPISSAVKYFAGVNSPLAMVVIGFHLATVPLKFQKGDGKMFISIALRLFAVPLICLAIFRGCGIRGELLESCIIPAAAPSAAIVMMFAAKFDGSTKLASKGMSFSHILSIIAMPLTLTICRLFI